MADGYTITKVEEVPDVSGDYPGAVRFMAGALESDQVAFSHRVMPPETGGLKGERIGHSHKTQEEIYFVVSGTMQLKLDDEVVEVGPGTAVRIAPETVRCAWNEGSDEVELLMVSNTVEDIRAEIDEMDPDFWP